LLYEMQLVAAQQGTPGDLAAEVVSLEDGAGGETPIEGAEFTYPYYLQHIRCKAEGQSLFRDLGVEGFLEIVSEADARLMMACAKEWTIMESSPWNKPSGSA
jgi:hypothetical protein